MQLAGVFDQNDAIIGLRDFGQQRVGERGLAGRGATRDEDVLAGSNGGNQRLGLPASHDLRRNIICEREHRDGGFADRETWCGHDRRQKPLEPLARIGQFG